DRRAAPWAQLHAGPAARGGQRGRRRHPHRGSGICDAPRAHRPAGWAVALQALGEESCMVNGRRVREAALQPGDQVVFDDHHRFVVEAPLSKLGELPMEHSPEVVVVTRQERASAWRLPWLLLAAVLLAGALSGLLLL